jgi:hypothetical protein
LATAVAPPLALQAASSALTIRPLMPAAARRADFVLIIVFLFL